VTLRFDHSPSKLKYLSSFAPKNDNSNLCLQCGLCCNGVIFADVAVRSISKIRILKKLGFPLTTRSRLSQPCAAFDGCRCTIYSQRPGQCKKFDCLLLEKVRSGQATQERAIQIIRKARRLVKTIEQLLEKLGNRAVDLPLRSRFKEVSQEMEASEHVDLEAHFGELTLKMHDLNLLLSEDFYPE
jgi:Fe-S-cluster containining protein